MRTTLRLAVSLGVISTLGWLAGCPDPEARRRAEAGARLEAAAREVSLASRGFLPEGQPAPIGEGQRVADLRTYQAQRLEEARGRLEAAIQGGSPAQQSAGRRLLADAYAASARYLTDQAVAEWAALSAQSTSLISELVNVDRAAAREVAASVDLAPTTAALTRSGGDLEQRLAELQRQAQQLEAQLQELNGQIEGLSRQSSEAMAQAQRRRQEAFTAEGQPAYELYGRAAEAERDGQRIQAQAQNLAVKRDVLAGELAIVSGQLALARQSRDGLREQEGEIQRRIEAAGTLAHGARGARAEATEKLVADSAALVQAYQQGVTPRFAAAQEQAAKATEAVRAAVSAALDRRSAEMDLLSKQIGQAHAYTQHAIAAGGLAQTMELLAAQAQRQPAPLMPGQASFAQAAAALRAEQREAAGQAADVITDALNLHATLVGAGGDERTAAILASQHEILQGYRSRLTAALTGVAELEPADRRAPPAPGEAPRDAREPAPPDPAAEDDPPTLPPADRNPPATNGADGEAL